MNYIPMHLKRVTFNGLFSLFLLVVLCLSCSSADESGQNYALPEEPDYADSDMWYSVSDAEAKAADVFYVTPTCIWDWQDERGATYHYMNVRDSAQRAAVNSGANVLASALFGKSCRFFAPYYRQITMESWFEDEAEINRRYVVAHEDVVRAFRYYMDHFNQGRPFFLAGHSQGGKAVIELLKHTLTEAEHKQLVAAYVFGFPISQAEIEQYPLLIPAKGAADYGVVVSYNSVSRPEACSPLFDDNVVCINPLNWATDTTYAPAESNLGSVFFHSSGQADTLRQQVGARLDTTVHALIIDGLSDEDYYIPSISRLFPKGNYHVQELNLYFLNIQQNLQQRIESFLQKKER